MTKHIESQTIFIIAAVGRNGVIGDSQGHLGLPWYIPEDLKNFKTLTHTHTVVMGRKTYELIGRSLPGRKNIVLTRSIPRKGMDCSYRTCAIMASSLPDALEKAGPGSVFIIGGASVYKEAIPLADFMLLTEVDREATGDTWFPSWSPDEWEKIEDRPFETESDVRFCVYKRVK